MLAILVVINVKEYLWAPPLQASGQAAQNLLGQIRASVYIKFSKFSPNFSLKIYFFLILSITFKKFPTSNSLNIFLF